MVIFGAFEVLLRLMRLGAIPRSILILSHLVYHQKLCCKKCPKKHVRICELADSPVNGAEPGAVSAGRELRCPAMGPKPPDQLQVHLLASQILIYTYPQLLKLGKSWDSG